MNSTIYRQHDSRWSSLPYPTKSYSFGHNGCGCCSVTHAAIDIEKYKNYTPADVRHGTLWKGITEGLKHYGYNVHWNQNDSMNDIFKVLKTSLKRGVILFGSTKGPDKTVWTTGGHYIYFQNYKYENNKHWFYLKDSGGRKHDKWWCYETSMKGDVRNVWICTSLTEEVKPAPKKETKPAKKKEEIKRVYSGSLPKSTIKKGSKGSDVKLWQKFLNWYGVYGLETDGIFGKLTRNATKKFQKAHGLKDDGIAGPLTHGKAKAYIKQVNP